MAAEYVQAAAVAEMASVTDPVATASAAKRGKLKSSRKQLEHKQE